MSIIYRLAAFVVGAKYKIFWGSLLVACLWGTIGNPAFFLGFYDIALGNWALALGVLALARHSNHTQNNVLSPVYAVAKRK